MTSKPKLNKKLKPVSIFTQWFYDMLGPKKVQEILGSKFQVKDEVNTIRLQCYIPKTLYICLSALGAFQTSESEFFVAMGSEYADKKIQELIKNSDVKGPLTEAH